MSGTCPMHGKREPYTTPDHGPTEPGCACPRTVTPDPIAPDALREALARKIDGFAFDPGSLILGKGKREECQTEAYRKADWFITEALPLVAKHRDAEVERLREAHRRNLSARVALQDRIRRTLDAGHNPFHTWDELRAILTGTDRG